MYGGFTIRPEVWQIDTWGASVNAQLLLCSWGWRAGAPARIEWHSLTEFYTCRDSFTTKLMPGSDAGRSAPVRNLKFTSNTKRVVQGRSETLAWGRRTCRVCVCGGSSGVSRGSSCNSREINGLVSDASQRCDLYNQSLWTLLSSQSNTAAVPIIAGTQARVYWLKMEVNSRIKAVAYETQS